MNKTRKKKEYEKAMRMKKKLEEINEVDENDSESLHEGN